MFTNKETYQSINQENGLTYNNITIEDSVNKDTDGDGIPDWQEGLYGLDPTKKETVTGTPDGLAINKLKIQQGLNTEIKKGNATSEEPENLTQTDQFSRELFATVATTSQNGTLDQATIEQLSASLADKIQNSPPKKVFLISEIKIINNDSVSTFANYNNTLNNIYKKYPMKDTVPDVLQKFMIDENNVDASALLKLDPIIEQTSKIINDMVKMNAPQSISILHLNIINALQRVLENISNIKLYDKDAILAIGAINQYQKNATALESANSALTGAIKQKLNN